MKRYKDSPFLTAGQVFGNGNGRLGAEVHDEVICRNEARKENEAGPELSRSAVLFIPIISTRANKTPIRADERRARGKARCCLLGLLES